MCTETEEGHTEPLGNLQRKELEKEKLSLNTQNTIWQKTFDLIWKSKKTEREGEKEEETPRERQQDT